MGFWLYTTGHVGYFDCVTASLREAATPLRMTDYLAEYRSRSTVCLLVIGT